MNAIVESRIERLEEGGALFLRAAKRFRVELDAKLRSTGMTACQYFLLNTLTEHGGMTQGALSQMTGVDRTALVSVIDELEEKKFVTRNEIPEDRRANRVELTETGKHAFEKSQEHFLVQQDSFLNGLNSGEIHTLNSLLRRLV